jgi:hypothetical protein
MISRSRQVLWVLVGAVFMGILADALLREIPWGINFSLWVDALVVTILILAWVLNQDWSGEGLWMLLLVFCLGAGSAWRDSPGLRFLDLWAVLSCLLWGLTRPPSKSIRLSGIVDYLARGATAGINAALGFPLLILADADWEEMPRSMGYTTVLRVAKGVLVAIPLLLVVGSLLVTADAVFEGIVLRILRIDLPRLLSHLFIIILISWVVAGLLRMRLMVSNLQIPQLGRPASLAFGLVETCVVVGLLNVLFLAFVIVQFRYLFGGASLVAVSPGLTYSEYARRGFFELVLVAALVLPLLLLFDWLIPERDWSHKRTFRLLAGLQIVLLLVIMASALQRMRLYQNQYGLTELRLYTTVFMLWLAIVCFWFIFTVLQNRRNRFTFGALVSGLLILAGLHWLNPDDMIFRINLGHNLQPSGFDLRYASALSADAVPATLEALPTLSKEQRNHLEATLLKRYSYYKQNSRLSWNWSRFQALRLIEKAKAGFGQPGPD